MKIANFTIFLVKKVFCVIFALVFFNTLEPQFNEGFGRCLR